MGEYELLEKVGDSRGDLPYYSLLMYHMKIGQESIAAQGYSLVLPEVLLAVEVMVTTSVIGKDLLSLIDLYRSLAKNDKPPPIKKSRTFTRENNDSGSCTAVEVFPYTSNDSMGPDADWRVEVWVDGEAVKQGVPERKDRLCLLLGAGNQTVLAFCDAFYYLLLNQRHWS